MHLRRLGNEGLAVSALGFGCMGLSGTYGGTLTSTEAIAVIHAAVAEGYSLIDTAELYGPFTNEELVGEAVKGRRENVVLCTKFGFRVKDGRIDTTDSRPSHIREAVEGSLGRLKTDYIDILLQHRVDPAVPIEDVVGEMRRLVEAGKVRYIGLSEANPITIRRAHCESPLSVVQSEYSLLERGVELDVLPTVRELGIGFMAFSPLGRGLIAGAKTANDPIAKNDYRRLDPRYQGTNLVSNLSLVEALSGMAKQADLSPAQLALAWLLHKGKDIVPIVGTTRVAALGANRVAAFVSLTPEQIDELDQLFAPEAVAGERYPPSMMRFIDATP
jgi:aryl-alcohol dehydrogenase-like predicted oxidoreductase